MMNRAPNTVNALVRGLLVLETVNTHGPTGLSNIWRQTGLPKATVFRLLESLRESGYLDYDPETKAYQVGLRTLALSNNLSYGQQLLQLSAPVMKQLRSNLGWPSDLAVFQHDKMVIFDTNREPGMLSTNRRVGARIPMMASATGRAYLASTDIESRHMILEQLGMSNDPYEALAKDPTAANQLLDETAGRGYAVSDQEFLETNRGAAVAVIHDGAVVCVINLIAIAKVVTLRDIERKYIPLLLDAKAQLENLLQRFPLRTNTLISVTRHTADGVTRKLNKK